MAFNRTAILEVKLRKKSHLECGRPDPREGELQARWAHFSSQGRYPPLLPHLRSRGPPGFPERCPSGGNGDTPQGSSLSAGPPQNPEAPREGNSRSGRSHARPVSLSGSLPFPLRCRGASSPLLGGCLAEVAASSRLGVGSGAGRGAGRRAEPGTGCRPRARPRARARAGVGAAGGNRRATVPGEDRGAPGRKGE